MDDHPAPQREEVKPGGRFGVNFKLGYSQDPVGRSETSEQYVPRLHRLREKQPSLPLLWPANAADEGHYDAKADLRGVHWSVSHQTGPAGHSEIKDRYKRPPATREPPFNPNLTRSNIDLAYGVPKTGHHWQSVQTGDMSRNEKDKFGCERPQGFEIMAKELRKSNVPLNDRGPPGMSEQRHRFCVPPPYEQARGYADTLGKDLRASHIELSNGQPRTTNWQSQMNDDMSRNNREKWLCRAPSGFAELAVELRKSSVPLGMNAVNPKT